MTQWDASVDVIAVGSGGGGLAAALAAREAGGDALVIEKRDLIGGSTAMSGGVVWLPNNPLMQDQHLEDSDEAGMEYFGAVVGDVGPASTTARRRAYITAGSRFVRTLQDMGVALTRCQGYADYYSYRPGGSSIGRSLEPVPFDGRVLGEWLPRVQPGMAAGLGLVVKTNELRAVQYYNRSVRAFIGAGRVWLRTIVARLLGRRMLTNGTALVAAMLKAALDRDVAVWTGVAVTELVVESGRVAGVRAVKDGSPVAVRARRGVVIASGGFAHSASMRGEHGGDQAVTGEWSHANDGDTGEVLRMAMDLGAATDLMDEAWWLPGPDPALATSTFGQARQRAGSILVDGDGQRFVNEGNSYMEVGKAMFARHAASPAVPSWLIVDDGYRRRYAHAKSIPGRLDPEWLRSGLLRRHHTLAGLAVECGIDPAGLEETVGAFNAAARRGEDPLFRRGQSVYNRCLGDPGNRPNPCLAPLERAPFYATPIYPRDVGTCGGLVTNEHAEVLRADGQPIAGLYATGNATATIMGRHYLGAGGSIGYSMVFGAIGAWRAMAGEGA